MTTPYNNNRRAGVKFLQNFRARVRQPDSLAYPRSGRGGVAACGINGLRARNYKFNCIFYLNNQLDGFTKGLRPCWMPDDETKGTRGHHDSHTAASSEIVGAISDNMGPVINLPGPIDRKTSSPYLEFRQVIFEFLFFPQPPEDGPRSRLSTANCKTPNNSKTPQTIK